MGTTTEDLTRRLARQLGAAHAWVVSAGQEEILAAVDGHLTQDDIVVPLDGMPVRCVDLRLVGRQYRDAGDVLVVRNDRVGPWGCASVRLGAHLALAPLDGVGTVVGVSRDVERVLPDAVRRLSSLATAGADEALMACAEGETRWHATSDAAQVMASFLRCHPRVSAVRYPGLKGDPSFEVAARTLQGGFGPLVDYRLCGEDQWRRLCCDDTPVRGQVLSVEALLASA